jgi:hypothetical protein
VIREGVVVVSARWARITVVAAGVATLPALIGAARVQAADKHSRTADATGVTAVTPVVGSTATADLGVVAVGEEIRHAFQLTNDGPAALTVHATRVPATVTVATIDRTIAPGAVGRVELALDTFALTGPSRVEVVLASDDPARPEIRLAVSADVRAFVVADPGFARYLFVQGARAGTIAQTVSATDGADFRVTRVISPLPHLRVTTREARPAERTPDAPGRQWHVESTLVSRPPVGPLAGFIEVALDHPRQHHLRIPVSGFVRPMFAVTPPAGELGDVRAGSPTRGRLLVKNFADESVTLGRVTSDVAGIGAEVTTVEPGHVFTILLTVAADAPPGAFDGLLHIRTSSAKEPAIHVPLRGRIVAANAAEISSSAPVAESAAPGPTAR